MLRKRFIKRVITAQGSIKTFYQRSDSLFPILLICGDLAFVVLHLLNALIATSENSLLSLETDKGYPEIYQYLKFFWIILIVILIALKNASWHYMSWAFIFTYFLFDDSLQIHEEVGWNISQSFNFMPILGLRIEDFGELAISSAAGIILLTPLVLSYRNGSKRFRNISQNLAVLVFVLLFFGIVLDMAHVVIKLGGRVSLILGTIEDGGEMLSVTLILVYALSCFKT